MEAGYARRRVQDEDLQLIPIIKNCWVYFLLYWKWFLLSVAACVAAGWLYQQRQARVYQRQAVMLIEDAEVSSMGGGGIRRSRGNMNSLLELNGISVGDNLCNEMFILTSKRLMERVVEKLGLDVDYTMNANLHEVTLYRDRPFEVRFAEKSDRPVSFSVCIQDDGTCLLDDFVVDGEKAEGVRRARPGESVKTPAGTLKIVADPAFSEFPENKEVRVRRVPADLAARIFKGRVSAAEFDKESALIVITCSDVNAGRAEDILNEVFNAYKQDVVDNKNRVAQSTADFIDSRIELIGNELSRVENQLADFKQCNRIINFETSAQLFAQESSTARQRSLALETQLEVAGYLADFLRDNSRQGDVIPVLTGLGDATFATQIAEYNKLVLNRNVLAENSSETAPKIREYDTQLASLRRSILSSVNSYVSSIRLQLREARATEARLSGKVGAVPEQEKYALDIKRQQSLKEALYTYLLNKREEVALQLAINEANVRMVEAPDGPPAPISPRKPYILLASLLLGIFIPVAVLWIRHLFDVTVSGRQDIEEHVTAPLVGELPSWSAPDAKGLISSCDSADPIVEAFRVLRYGLTFIKRSAKVFVVTSTTPAQGKSFVSRNLSVVLAMADKRVLLIDADVRKRTQSVMFGKTPGLTAYLAADEGDVDVRDLILPDAVREHVDFLPAGILPPNPSELLMSSRFEDLIDRMREEYDYVIIDTTPLLSVADASIVARVADMTLYVVRVGVQEKGFLPEIEKMYKDKKFRNLCIVLNDSDAKPGYNANGYGYGYGKAHPKKKRGLFDRKPS